MAGRPSGLLLLLAGLAGVSGLRNRHEKAPHGPYHWANNGERHGKVEIRAPRALKTRPAWTFMEEQKGEKSKRFPNATGMMRANPLVDDKLNVYMSTVTTGNIYKLSPEGEVLWSHSRNGAKIGGTSSLHDGKVIAADNKGNVFALDMETGNKLYNTQIATFIADDAWSLASSESDNTVVVPAVRDDLLAENPKRQNDRVVALEATTGKVKWAFSLIGDAKLINAAFSIRSGSVVFSDTLANVYRIDLQTGKSVWQSNAKKCDAETIGGATIGPRGDKVYVTWNELGWEVNSITLSGKLGCYNFTDGRHLWTYSFQHPTFAPPSVGIVGHGKMAEYAVVVPNGMRPDLPDPEMGVGDNFGDEKKSRLTIIRAEEGVYEGMIRTWYDLEPYYGSAKGDEFRDDACQPMLALSEATIGGDGTVYLGHMDGSLYSFHDDDENAWYEPWEVGTYATSAGFASRPIVAPGLLLAAPCDGLRAWKF